MIHAQVWYWLEEINDVLVPGPGQLVGFGKKDVFGPLDLIPVVGPIRKLHKVTKVWKQRRKVKSYIYWGANLVADVLAIREVVEWYNSRYEIIAAMVDDDNEPDESPLPSQSGNADEEISGGGGTKKKPYSSRSTSTAKYVKCNAPGRRQFGGKCIRRKGHSGPHFYK